jgi:Tol biopolymer transport system component
MLEVLRCRGGGFIILLPPRYSKEKGMTRTVLLSASVLLALVVACAAALLIASMQPAKAAFPGANGKIAFHAWRGTAEGPDGGGTLDADIFSMNPDGSGQRRLTDTSWFNYDPAWSADGTKIAFTNQIAEDSSGGVDTYLMDADGSDEMNLTRTDLTFESEEPAWFPSGRKIVTSRHYFGSGDHLYTVAFDESGNVTQTIKLTGGDDFARDRAPAVSPDGRKIAFVSFQRGDGEDTEIYVIGAGRPEGPDNPAVQLTRNTTNDGAPDWSPDGTQIVYGGVRNGNAEILVMNADGSGKKNITHSSAPESGPAWSPDGKQIAFESLRGGDSEIFRMRADGSHRIQLTFNTRDDSSPDWQPLP